MSDIPSLFDAQSARDAGMSSSARHSGQDWQSYAEEFVRVYLRRNPNLFCDDVWNAGLARPESPRAFGQIMKTALRWEWMVPTNQARPSVQSNMSVRKVYQSRLYDPLAADTYPLWRDATDETRELRT